MVSDSGWDELPPIRDMARLQFGQSTCQVEGLYTPVADIKLASGDSIYFTHHILLWMDPGTTISTMPLRGAWKRMFAGLPLIMAQTHGPARIAFSRDEPGEMVALPINPGSAVDVREGGFMLASGNVAYDWFQTGIWFTTASGDDRETHYPLGSFMDRFSTGAAPGLVLLHGQGNVFVRTLAAGQHILVKPQALLYKDVSVQMCLHLEHPGGTWRTWRTWGERYVWLRLVGPGRIAVQSAYPPDEDAPNNLSSVCPNTTRWQW
jgi:uncharacterized protein (AIM24 family)